MNDFNFKVPLPASGKNLKAAKANQMRNFTSGTSSSENSLSTSSMSLINTSSSSRINFSVPKLDNQYRSNTSSFFPHEAAKSVGITPSGSLFTGKNNSNLLKREPMLEMMPSTSGSSMRGNTNANFLPRETSTSTSSVRGRDTSNFLSRETGGMMPSMSVSSVKGMNCTRLGNVHKNNVSHLFSNEASMSTSASSTLKDSFISLNSTKKALFSSGLEIVDRGAFGKMKNVYSDVSMGQQLMLPDSSRTIMDEDNQSVAGSVMSMASNMSVIHSLKNKVQNRFESLESFMKQKFSRTENDRFLIETIFKRNQEMFLNDMQKELSLAMSFRDIDACSTFNETAKNLYGIISKSQSQSQNISAIKSSKEYLSEVRCNNQPRQTNEIQFYTTFETSRRDEIHGMVNENEENDETILFKSSTAKVPKIMASKTVSKTVVPQKKPVESVNVRNTSKSVIYLQKWFPVAVGNDLKFSGTDKRKEVIETKAIKKRIDNRTVELVDGKKCIIEGSPDWSIVSAFSSTIRSKLKNGLTLRWKVLQKDISNCQENYSSIPKSKAKEPDKKRLEMDYTPRTRKITDKENGFPRDKENFVNSPLNTSTPLRNKGAGKNKDKSLTKCHPVVMIDKNEIAKAKKISPEKSVGKKIEERKKISPKRKIEEKAKILPKRKIEEKTKISPKKRIEERKKPSPRNSGKKVEVQKSRSGRTIKPLGSLWTDSSYIFNVNRKPSPDKKSKNETMNVNRNSLDGSRKRKRDSENENEAKPAKVKKRSLEEKKKLDSPVKKSPAGRKKIPPPVRRNKKSPAKKKSPIRRSPGKRKSPSKTKSPARRKSSPKIKSPGKRKPPVKISPVKKAKNQRGNKSVLGADKKKNWAEPADFDEFECQLDDIDLPEISAEERKAQLTRSQLRIASMETPPLQYFSQNLRILNTTTTPHQSPDWQISQHSQSAVRRFGERRAKTFKQKIPAGSPAPSTFKNTRKSPRNKDLKTVTDWIGDKDVRSPKKRSKLINLVIPSRRQLEDDESESD